MRILLTGASGLIGSALRSRFSERGDGVRVLVRRSPRGPDERRWDPARGEIDPEDVAGFDTVVVLNGVVIGGRRWTQSRRSQILASRVEPTRVLVDALLDSGAPPAALVSASAIGYYGDRGDEVLDEASGPGSSTEFVVSVVDEWEGAAKDAEMAGIRVSWLRTALVLASEGGILPRMALPFRFGVGGRIGSGTQWWSWITIDDAVRAYEHVIDRGAGGPVNVATPNPVTNRDFTEVLGRVLDRPTFLPTPRLGLDAVLGRAQVGELLYGSTRVRPSRLEESGFVFGYPELEPALRHVLRR